MPIEPRMLTEARQEFLIELLSCNGGLSILPSPPSLPEPHRFQGELIRSDMMEIAGTVLAPAIFHGRGMRIWLDRLKSWHFRKSQPSDIGDLYDRTGELPGGGLDAMIYIPQDAWLPALHCLGTKWRHLQLTGVNGNGERMTVVDFSFSSGGPETTGAPTPRSSDEG